MSGERTQRVVNEIYRHKLVAIARGMETELCKPLSEALYAGGIRLMEITFDQTEGIPFSKTADTIAALAAMWEGEMQIGAGTVLSLEQLYMAKEAGARYIVTPNTNIIIIQEAKKLDMAVLAGAFTPSEMEAAYAAGADFIKVFPAASLGTSYIKAVKAPLSHIPMLAVGGVDEKNIGEFLQAGMAGAGIGGNLVNRKLIQQGDYGSITALAKQYTALAGA